MARVFLTCLESTPWMQGFLAELQEALAELAPRYVSASSASAADIVLYMAPGYNRFRGWTDRLLEVDTIAQYPNRCFVYDYSDRPITFLPGLYTSLPESRIDKGRIRSADRWTRISEHLPEVDLRDGGNTRLLLSFRGFASADVRRALFAIDFGREDVAVTRTDRWWDYSEGEDARMTYLSEMAASTFVLCPRGLAPSTYRLYETMQMGRVPVILADEWAPSAGPPWQEFSIRVSEDRVTELVEILEPRRGDAAEMGRAARAAWENWMKPGPVLLKRWLQAIEEMLLLRPTSLDEADMRARWRSQRFRWENEIHPVQGVRDAFRTGTIREKLAARLLRKQPVSPE